jgi:hypothetical protein
MTGGEGGGEGHGGTSYPRRCVWDRVTPVIDPLSLSTLPSFPLLSGGGHPPRGPRILVFLLPLPWRRLLGAKWEEQTSTALARLVAAPPVALSRSASRAEWGVLIDHHAQGPQ